MTAKGCAGLVVLCLVWAAPLDAQRGAVVHVVDETGRPVPYAVVSVNDGQGRVADDSGRVRIVTELRDSLRLRVRRIGFTEFYGHAKLADGGYLVRLPVAAQHIAAMTVSERASTPLSRTGFYERLERVQKGATVGEFITPEELDQRGSSKVSDLLYGRRYVRPTTAGMGRAQMVLLGRGNCAMTIIVDGQVMVATAQDDVLQSDPTSFSARPSSGADRRTPARKPDINDLVDANSVMAIEIYPSSSNAPAELQSLAGRGSCGIVAVWTGPRQ